MTEAVARDSIEAYALSDIAVVQWGGGVACGYAAKLLADFGARVTFIEDAQAGPQERIDDGLFKDYLNQPKSTVVLDSATAAGREQLLGLLGAADVLFESHAPARLDDLGLGYAGIAKANPRLVMVSVTPYGQTGPYRDFTAGDAEIAFLSGLAHLTPRDIARDHDPQPPLKMPGSLVSIYAGVSAAGAALTALRGRDGSGAGAHVDVSMLECLIPTLRRELALWQYEDIAASRFMRVWKLAPWGVKPCKDGHVFLQIVEKHHWQALVEMMGSPDWATDPRYLDADYRYENRTEIERRMAPWLTQHAKGELARQAQSRAIPFAPVNTVADVIHIPQLHHRKFFTVGCRDDQSPYIGLSHPFKFTGNQAASAPQPVPQPRHRAAQQAQGPLAGLRVVDFGHVWAGPYCAATLADMGADVIKIESRHRVDIHRRQGPYPERRPGHDRSAVWNAQNRGKRSVTLNLSTAEGLDLARTLVAGSDVVIENFAPGVMRRLGLDYESLCAVKPDIVMASLSAFGQDGPQRRYVGYGPSLDAWAGLDSLTAYPGGAPNALGGVFPDTGSALFGVAAILAALRYRDRTGRGQYIDVSELEVSILLAADRVIAALNGAVSTPQDDAGPSALVRGTYACAGEDEWISLSAPDTATWKRLCQLIGRDDCAKAADPADPRARTAQAAEIGQAISRWCAAQPAHRAMQQLQQAGIPAGVAYDVPMLLADAQMKSRDYFKPVYHPETGTQYLYGPIWRMDTAPDSIRGHAPLLGQHSREVLRDRLGMSDAELDALAESRVVY